MSILDLGCGDLNELNEVTGEITAIDKKNIGTAAKHITFIQGDFFETEITEDFDLIRAHYSLCFNTREKIEKKLPQLLKHLKTGGILEIKDFHTSDQVVKKRTNLYDSWFFNLIKQIIGPYQLNDEKVFEQEHGHEHRIFILRAKKM